MSYQELEKTIKALSKDHPDYSRLSKDQVKDLTDNIAKELGTTF